MLIRIQERVNWQIIAREVSITVRDLHTAELSYQTLVFDLRSRQSAKRLKPAPKKYNCSLSNIVYY